MERSRVTELHYIAPLANLESIMKRGILSHQQARRIDHTSVADAAVQERRVRRIPNGRWLHECANLYFDARNPMMYKRLDRKHSIAVVYVSSDVLDIAGILIADGNAAAAGTRFHPAQGGVARLRDDRVYARFWTDGDWSVQAEKKRQRCAEVLVPDRVPPDFIRGVYVCDDHALARCQDLVSTGTATVNRYVFFS